MQPIGSLACNLLPCSYAPDGAVAHQITVLDENTLQMWGEMWFLGDRGASWTEPMQFMVELHPSTEVVQVWMLSVGDAATGFQPGGRKSRERRRGSVAPTEWLLVIKGPQHSGLNAEKK